jgi:ADP-ribose pyrophosphatase YjhB (NUDIX family)
MHTIRAIAVFIANPLDTSLLLIVRRPDDDEDLPGVWGLPATSIKDNESDHAAALRLGTRKLGADLTLGAVLAEGTQERATQHLVMNLYAATLGAASPILPEPNDQIDGSTYYTDWQWAPRESANAGAEMGSLCCQLALQINAKESM